MLRIFGPPGTGKTTTLLNMVDDALSSGVAPTQIAFLAYTRKAATEAKERASARFGLDPKKDLVYFRTIHSLALALSTIRADQIMQQEHYKEIGHHCGVSLGDTALPDFEEDLPTIASSKDPILGLINLARLRKVPLRVQYNASNVDIPWNVVAYVDRTITAYKNRFGLFDFTDMLETFVKEANTYCPRFQLTFVDEAQDLSPLQWDIAHILDDNSSRMYVAGDDDQAIYAWAGADVDHFINLPGGSETLHQSFRVPRAVHRVAENVASRIYRRFPKRYDPRPEEGSVSRIHDVETLLKQGLLDSGNWLVLAQSGYMLAPVALDLKSSGYLFNYRGHRSISERISAAVNGWEQLRKGRTITVDTARTIYSLMSMDRIKRGFKKLPGLEDSDTVHLEMLIADHGLLANKDMIWSEALDRIPQADRAYITALLRRGEKFNAAPRITISTIHGSKGGEADNVVLFTDLSPAASSEMQNRPDDMHRVFYVGVTRAKQNLYIVEAEDRTRGYDL